APTPAPAPGTPPAPSSAPGPIPDRAAPLLGVSVSPNRSLRDLVRRTALRSRVRCSEACRLSIQVTLPAQTARRLGFGRVTRPVALARTTATTTRAGTVTRRLRLSTTERRRLNRARSVRLTVRVRATDPAGNVRNRITRVSLRR
ncbi:MAG: hypothetical protein M3459_09970, partial [Actinomycetota bacterium]|nr:hypothetical protein [Actinomycetota bacterium]